MTRWTQPLLLTASVLLSLPSSGAAHPANHYAIHANKRQDAPPAEVTPVPRITEAPVAEEATPTDTYTGPYPCVNFGGPRVATPHCQCSTTTAGQQFVTEVPLVDGQCSSYHEYPGEIPVDELNKWRTINCESEGVTDHTQYGPDRWKNVDASDAWNAVVEGWNVNITSGREQKNFANNVSNFFHGPQDMFCETFSDEGSGCEDLNLQCNSVSAPAGYFILHSFENIFSMHSNIWNAVGDAVRDNDIGSIASEFGKVPPKEGGISASIAIDIAMIAWGLVMGPAWNKLIGPKVTDATSSGTSGAIKDTANDLVKNSMTLTKDILNSRAQDQLGVQNGLTAQMQALTEGWKDGVSETQKWLFGGSEAGYKQLGDMISDASMFGDSWLLDRGDHSKQVKRAINAFLIPMAWQYSPDVIFPFIAESDAACDQDPGYNHEASFTTMFQRWLEQDALDNGRVCIDGKSYWLLGGRDRNTNCDSKSGDAECGDFALPPGFQSLKDKKYTDISLENVIRGSLNSKNANGGKNGFKLNMQDEPSREVLESLAGSGIEAPGVFNIPICSMDEVIENYYLWYGNSREDMTNFPCNV